MKNRNLENHDNWKTPEKLYNYLDNIYNFDFDPCPYCEGKPLFDGLICDWGEVNFVNPPYSRKLKDLFIQKSVAEYKKGKTIVILIPSATGTKVFHELLLPNNPDIIFIKGRVSFSGYNSSGKYVTDKKGMHDSMIIVLNPKKKIKNIGVSTLVYNDL